LVHRGGAALAGIDALLRPLARWCDGDSSNKSGGSGIASNGCEPSTPLDDPTAHQQQQQQQLDASTALNFPTAHVLSKLVGAIQDEVSNVR
jgi:hypothetical protein